MAWPDCPDHEKILRDLQASAPEEISAAGSLDALSALQARLLGRKSRLTELLKSLKDFPLEERKRLGPEFQALKERLEALLETRAAQLRRALLESELNAARVDTSLPGARFPRGHLHPLTLTLRRMVGVLERMGFAQADGPHVESDYFNFEALNIPPEHPARDLHDTFYVRLPREARSYIPGPHPKPAPAALLRTHTSPVQIRSMLKQAPGGRPLRLMSPGRVFRHEASDATHSAVFHQLEGLYVDRRVSLANLKGTLGLFIQGLFGKEARTRLTPSYFPFVEPGLQADISCVFCRGSGAGCSVCKQTGWIEMLGAGLVHPNVLRCGGYDPEEWSGYAFGIGVERVAMLLFGVDDLRTFYENDLRFLEQF